MTDAEIAVERHHAKGWAGVRFAPGRKAKVERDKKLTNVTFYRFGDGSVARYDKTTGDAEA